MCTSRDDTASILGHMSMDIQRRCHFPFAFHKSLTELHTFISPKESARVSRDLVTLLFRQTPSHGKFADDDGEAF